MYFRVLLLTLFPLFGSASCLVPLRQPGHGLRLASSFLLSSHILTMRTAFDSSFTREISVSRLTTSFHFFLNFSLARHLQ